MREEACSSTFRIGRWTRSFQRAEELELRFALVRWLGCALPLFPPEHDQHQLLLLVCREPGRPIGGHPVGLKADPQFVPLKSPGGSRATSQKRSPDAYEYPAVVTGILVLNYIPAVRTIRAELP